MVYRDIANGCAGMFVWTDEYVRTAANVCQEMQAQNRRPSISSLHTAMVRAGHAWVTQRRLELGWEAIMVRVRGGTHKRAASTFRTALLGQAGLHSGADVTTHATEVVHEVVHVPHNAYDCNMMTYSTTANIACVGWQHRHVIAQVWHEKTKVAISGMQCCGVCGKTAFGGLTEEAFVRKPLPAFVPLFSVASLHLAPYVKNNDGYVELCSACAADDNVLTRATHTVQCTPMYLRKVLSVQPTNLMYLSFINNRLPIQQRYGAFAQSHMAQLHLLDSPLVLTQGVLASTIPAQDLTTLQDVLNNNLHTNPFYRRHCSLIERKIPSFLNIDVSRWPGMTAATMNAEVSGYAPPSGKAPHEHLEPVVLTSNAVAGILKPAQARSPLPNTGMDAVSQVLATYVDALPDKAVTTAKIPKQFVMGEVFAREDENTATMLSVDGQGASVSRDVDLTVETSLFGFLFPFGKGFWQKGQNFSNYLHMRFMAFFTIFTLCKPYLLYMFLLQRASTLVTSVSYMCLAAAIATYKKRNPEATEQQAYRFVMKYKVPATLPGSPLWFKGHLDNLLYRVSRNGMPTLFMTLTADEVSNLRWQEIVDLEAFLQRFANGLTYTDAAVECAALFVRRCRAFLKQHVFLPAGGILGRITAYMIRYEVQGRGSVHAHILLWVHPEDRVRVGSDICAHVPAERTPGNDGYIVPHDPQQNTLFHIVMRKQIHTCDHNRCLRQHPHDPNKHFCKMGFPFAVQTCNTPTLDAATNRYHYFRPRTCDSNVVPYHPLVLLLWNAHMNIQVITEAAWSRYVLKYATKCEPNGALNLNRKDGDAIGLQGLEECQLKMVAAFCTSRPVSASEAALHLMRVQLVDTDIAVRFISTAPFAYRKTFTTAYGSQPPKAAPVDVYVARPDTLAHMTMYAYFRRTVQRDRPYKHLPRRFTDAPLQRDLLGSYVYILKADEPDLYVRYDMYHPAYKMEAYCYNMLLQHVPFTSEAELLNGGRTSYIAQCHAMSLLSTEQHMEEALATYHSYHLYDTQEAAMLLQSMLDQQHVVLTNGGRIAGDTEDDEALLRGPIQEAIDRMRLMTPPLLAMHPDNNTYSLTPDQKAVIASICNAQKGMHVIQGGPGCGKTFITQFLAYKFRCAGMHVLLCGSTGVCSCRLDSTASTLHSTVNVGRRGSRYWSPLAVTNVRYHQLLHADVIIVDEISMVTSDLLNMLMLRLQGVLANEAQNNTGTACTDPLQNKLIIMVGDMAQLPPVCTEHKVPAASFCKACHISNSPWWPQATMHTLHTNVRQAQDPEYLTFLNIIRTRAPTQTEIDTYLQHCYVHPHEALARLTAETTIICTHRLDVDRYNTIMLNQLFHAEAVQQTCVRTTATPDLLALPSVQQELHDRNHHTLPSVALGAKVTLTSNLNLEKGACNGAIGHVTGIQYQNGEIHKLQVTLAGHDNPVNVYRSTSRTCYHGVKEYRISTFPLQLAYAITGHRCQGATLTNPVLLHVGSTDWCPGLLYVMLSRVSKRSMLHVVGKLTPYMFVPMPAP